MLSEKGLHNWVKASLGLQITRDGLLEFVENEVTEFQQNLLKEIWKIKRLPSGTICTECSLQNVLPCNTINLCVFQQGKCIVHDADKKFKKICPNNICDEFRDRIRTAFRYYMPNKVEPSWRNSKTEKWNIDPLSVAKCFMSSEYGSTINTWEQMDFNCLINVIINNTWFQKSFMEDLCYPRNICHQARQVGQDVCHCSSLSITDKDLAQYLTTLTKLLADQKLLTSDAKANKAINKLKQLLNHSIIGCTPYLTQYISEIKDIDKKQVEIIEDKTLIEPPIVIARVESIDMETPFQYNINEVQDDLAAFYLAHLSDYDETFLMESNRHFTFKIIQKMCYEECKEDVEEDIVSMDASSYYEAFCTDEEISKCILLCSEDIKLSSKNLILDWVHGIEKKKTAGMLSRDESFMAAFDAVYFMQLTESDSVKNLNDVIKNKSIGVKQVNIENATECILSDTNVRVLIIIECSQKLPKDLHCLQKNISNLISSCSIFLFIKKENIPIAKNRLGLNKIVKMQTTDILCVQMKRNAIMDIHEINKLAYDIEAFFQFQQRSENKTIKTYTLSFEELMTHCPVLVFISENTQLKMLQLKNCDPKVAFVHPAVCLKYIGKPDKLPYTQLLSNNLKSFIYQMNEIKSDIYSHVFFLNTFKDNDLRYLFKFCENLQEVTLLMTIGKHEVKVNINQTEIKEINKYLKVNCPVRYSKKLFRDHLQSVKFSKDDFNVETVKQDSFADEIILHVICYTFMCAYDNIIKIFPAMVDGKGDVILVCFMQDGTTNKLPSTYRGFNVFQKLFSEVSSESQDIENSVKVNDDDKGFMEDFISVDETVTANVDVLMSRHSNLEAVAVSKVRSKNGCPVDDSQPIIVLYCRLKSYIPYKETIFPTAIKHPFLKNVSFETDIREGYFIPCMDPNLLTGDGNYYTKELAMGCSVGLLGELHGATLGPFVYYQENNGTENLCFVTTCHLSEPWKYNGNLPEGRKVVQPFHEQKVCGEVISAEFNEEIDAMLIKINLGRLPSRGGFVNLKAESLLRAGFTLDNFPTFDDGAVKDPRMLATRESGRIIKVGSESGLSHGVLELTGTNVRCADDTIIHDDGNGCKEFKLRRQIFIESLQNRPFMKYGDSGAAVFLVDGDNKLYCIGIAIGILTDSRCVVTPIQAVLEHLGKKIGKHLKMKQFSFEEMS